MKELTKELRIITMRNGVQLSIEKDRADKIVALMEQRKFIEIDGRIINVVDIVGIFTPADLEATTRRKNGQWQDSKGRWQEKGSRECPTCGNIIPYGMKCGNCGN